MTQGIYLHIPFCEIKCAYCDFFSVTRTEEAVKEEYVVHLIREIEAKGTGEPADTVFIGGGTPSTLLPSQIGRILEALGKAFRLTPDAELTMEANPETVNEQKLRDFRAAGMNRISFGVQSLDDRILKALGRIHSADRARRAVEEARAAGFAEVNADLMFGLPGQTAGIWRRDLAEVVTWPITHLSCYELTIEGDTAFGRRPPVLPDEPVVLSQWEAVMAETARAGFAHYEVSNYAQPGHECRHNLKYWRDEDWFGFGAAAWGAQAGVRTGNPKSLKKYYEGAALGYPAAETDALPLAGRMAETLVLNLRLRVGCDVPAYETRYGAGALGRFGPALTTHVAAGRIDQSDRQVRLTDRGLLVANSVWADIYAAIP
jgi:oxygen-independent coproporphyrinogen-3 oxidase